MRPRRHPFWLIFLAALAAVLAAGSALAQSSMHDVPLGPPVQASLPDLGSSADAVITRADEYQIGRMMMRNLRDQGALFDDPETADYMQAVGSRIGVEAQDGKQRLTYYAVHDPSIQAYAMPGGFIVINTGLILLTNAESELAGVIAHETGHVVQRHIARAVQAQGKSSIATMAGMLAGILLGAVTGNANVIPGAIALAQGTAMQQQINFTRMEEHEADRVGILYLAEAGFDPNGMAAMFSSMMRNSGTGRDDFPSMLLTHPTDSVRIAEARARAAAMPDYPRRPDSASYPLIRERVRVLAVKDSDLRAYYARMRQNEPGNTAYDYGLALAELKSGSAAEAVSLLRPLVAARPDLPLLLSALAQAELAAGQKAQAMATFERGLELSPRNVPLSVRYAEALLDEGQARKAHQLLLDLFNNVAPTPDQIKLTALAASSAGDIGDAYFYMAEYHISSGDLMLATTQLDLALAAPNLTPIQRKRFLARRDEIREYLREQRSDRSGRASPQG